MRSAGPSVRGATLQHFNRRQNLAFNELEESAATRGNIGNTVAHAVLVDRGQSIAAAGYGKRIARGDRLGQDAGSVAETIEFEDADRPVPDDRA